MAAALVGAYIYGVASFQQNLLDRIQARPLGTHDELGRLLSYPGKVKVPCPRQTADVAVILAIGQSNIANHGSEKIATRYPGRVLNFFDGQCFVAASPLLGATAEGGEFLTLLADDLVEDGAYKTVVIISSGISGTPISRWQHHGDLNDRLIAPLRAKLGGYEVTEIVWHQGESDRSEGTSAKAYQDSFMSLLASLREVGVRAPAFIAVATKCGPVVEGAANPVAAGQRGLVDGQSIFLGADSDGLLGVADRQKDNCHLSERGQRKIALSYATAIKKARLPR